MSAGALLDVSGVSRSFGGFQALSGVTLQVAPGEISAVIGPNGAGKTTLFNVITGHLAPDAGRVGFAGYDITGETPWVRGLIDRHHAKAAADGYTLLGGNPGPLTIAPSLRKQLAYDPNRDFTPITLIARSASCMCAHPSLPAKGIREFVALAKASPGKINYATPGVGTVGHLAIEHFSTLAGIRMTHVPYKGAALYTVDLIAGNMDFAQIQIFQAVPYVRGGKLRALGVTAVARSALLPEVPTAEEQGVKGFSSYNWNGILAPAGTPRAVIERIHAVLAKPLTNPDTRKQMEATGYEVAGDGPAEYAAFIRAETDKWAKVAKAAGIKPE